MRSTPLVSDTGARVKKGGFSGFGGWGGWSGESVRKMLKGYRLGWGAVRVDADKVCTKTYEEGEGGKIEGD